MTVLIPSQAARDAAAEMHAEMGGTATGCDMIRSGDADGAPAARILARFEEQIRKDERERCAAYLDGYAGGHYMAQSCAAAIRSTQGGE